jgi:hypothetical protein
MVAIVLEIKGDSAIVYHCVYIITKRLSSLTLAVKIESYYNEQ